MVGSKEKEKEGKKIYIYRDNYKNIPWILMKSLIYPFCFPKLLKYPFKLENHYKFHLLI